MKMFQKCIWWEWTSFFAWYPVRITEGKDEGKIAWLCTLERRYWTKPMIDGFPDMISYRSLK